MDPMFSFILVIVYSCLIDIQSSNYVYKTLEKPKITVAPLNISVIANDQALLVCMADGNPRPRIRWSVNGNTKLPGNFQVVRQSVLRIVNAYPHNDGDYIQCKAVNVMGVSIATAVLNVYPNRNTVTVGYPQYLSKASIIVSQKDSDETLECSVVGNPSPRIMWFMDYFPVNLKRKRYYLKHNRNLFIKKAKKTDSGKYQCLAINKHGSILSDTITLMVRVSQYDPYFTYVTPDQSVTPGSSLQINCSANGSPSPKLIWKCGGTELTHTTVRERDKTNITIFTILSDMSDPLKCQCVARVNSKIINHTLHISIKNIPAAPKIIQLTSITTDSSIVTWQQNKTHLINVTGFEIFYVAKKYLRKKEPISKSIEISPRESIDPSLKFSTKINNLTPYTTYSVWIIALGGEGASEPSVIKYFQTKSDKPMSAPTNISIYQKTETSVLLTWSPPVNANGLITEYTVFYSTSDSTDSIWKRQTNPEPDLYSTIKDLKPNTMYYFRIRSTNQKGVGPVSNSVSKFINIQEIYNIHSVKSIFVSSTIIVMKWRYNRLIPQTQIQDFLITAQPKNSHFQYNASTQSQTHRIQRYNSLTTPITQPPNTVLNQYFFKISRLTPNTKYLITITPIPMLNSVDLNKIKPSKTTIKTKFKDQSASQFSSEILSSTSISISTNDNSQTFRVSYQILDQSYSPDSTILSCVLSRRNSCIMQQLSHNTLYKINILKSSAIKTVMSVLYEKTWKIVPEPISNLKLQLKCKKIAPCILAKWDYSGRHKVYFRVKFYPINTQDSLYNESKYQHVFNTTEHSYQTISAEHVPGYKLHFQVTAVSSRGAESKVVHSFIKLPGKKPSSFPKNISLIWEKDRVSPFAVTFDWKYPPIDQLNGPITKVEVQCNNFSVTNQKEQPAIFQEKYDIQKATQKSQIVGLTWELLLKNRKGIFCKLRFYNKMGHGKWSKRVLINLYKKSYQDPPKNIRAFMIPGCCVKVTWAWENDYLYSYSYFRVKIFKNNVLLHNYRTNYPSTLFYWGTSLSPKQNLSVSIQSIYTDDNESKSNWSKRTRIYPYDHTRAIVDVANLKCRSDGWRQIQLTWTYQRENEDLLHFRVNFSGVTQYNKRNGDLVKIRRNETENSLLKPTKPTTTYSHTISENLYPDTTYTFFVEPILKEPSKIWSRYEKVECKTRPEAPDSIEPPHSLQIVHSKKSNSSSIDLFIPIPQQINGAIKFYYLLIAKSMSSKTNNNKSPNYTTTIINLLYKWSLEYPNRLTNTIDFSTLSCYGQFRNIRRKIIKNQHNQYGFVIKLNSYRQKLNQKNHRTQPMPVVPSSVNRKRQQNCRNKPLDIYEIYRSILIICIENPSNSNMREFNRICRISKASTPFQLSRPQYDNQKQYDSKLNNGDNDLDGDSKADKNLIQIIIGSIVLLVMLIFIAFIVTLIIKKKNGRVYQMCFKKRPITTDYFANSSSDLKENLVNSHTHHTNTYINSTHNTQHTTSFIVSASNNNIPYNNECSDMKVYTNNGQSNNNLYNKYPTPDLLVQSASPSTSLKASYHASINPIVNEAASTSTSNAKQKIPLTLLYDYVYHLKLNEGRGFSLEFQSIDSATYPSGENSSAPTIGHTSHHSNIPGNKAKNRYANIVSYDHSRVVLQNTVTNNKNGSLPSLCSSQYENDSRCNTPNVALNNGGSNDRATDYINANYIDGYRKQNAYIATQGCLPETVNDFWTMVWEQRSSVIVMLTQLTERMRDKCELYWPKIPSTVTSNTAAIATSMPFNTTKPSNLYVQFGQITVQLASVVELAYYTQRVFYIQKSGCSEKREIRHFQLTCWPDIGVPHCTSQFLSFTTRIQRESNNLDSGPIIVHCSSGVGRTGVFITVNSMIEQLRHTKSIDVFNYVSHIRQQRNYMVQTEEQYVFIYDVLVDYLYSINNEINSSQLYHQIEKLNNIEISSNGFIQVSGYQQEFRCLLKWNNLMYSLYNVSTHADGHNKSSSSAKSVESVEYGSLYFETALLNANTAKNRSPTSLPPEHSRVLLRPIKNIEGSDYINASWIDSFSCTKGFIATQSPLKESIEDFWRMLWEYDCGIIVNLQQDNFDFYQYWPKERSVRYQFFVVDPVSEYEMQPHYTLREFKLTDARDGQTRMLRQFQFITSATTTIANQQNEESTIASNSATSVNTVSMVTESLVELIEQVYKTRSQFGYNGPIVVHCNNCSTKTGTFIGLAILIEHLKFDQTINVFEIFKLLKWQRPSLIDSEDQYQFCFLGLLEYLNSMCNDDVNIS